MKKTIKILVDKMNKLQETKSGRLEGGFLSIKGGLNKNVLSSTNTSTGPSGCTNSGDCIQTTNTSLHPCSNTGSCYM
ncbi:hypothetical protein [Rhizosphaericola mali]|uniref:Uncharacterized protein n=1 Tax=Rhizosphaericola mali TaxID=2545455 RepID=A0A5P2G8Q6_9BACT|nr:hypothetical protein [Rhizosphaericola mali]QES91068.1 hypothetical protein E0W69_020355 [Rhizosphaericola mali]